MRKNIFFIVCIFFCTSTFATENLTKITYNYSKQAHYAIAGFSNNSFQGFFASEIFPKPMISNWGIKQNYQNFLIQGGKLNIEGSKSKMTNPDWSSNDVLHTPKVPSIYSKATLQEKFSSSINNSIFLDYKFPSISHFQFRPEVSFLWLPSFTESETDTSLYFASVQFPYNFGKNELNKITFSFNYGSNYFSHTDDDWFMKYPFFNSYRNSIFLEEITFTNRYFSIYSNFLQTQDQFGKLKLLSRSEAKFKLKLSKKASLSMEGRFLISDTDFFTLDKKNFQTPLHYSIMSQLYFKTDKNYMTLSFLYDDKSSYINGHDKIYEKNQCFQTGFKSEFDFWYFSTKFKYYPDNHKKNEICFDFWSRIIPVSNFKTNINLYINEFIKFQPEEWNFYSSAKISYKNFYNQIIFSLKDNYNFTNLKTYVRVKTSYGPAWIDIDIKKTASEQFCPETAIEFSAGIKLKY